MTGPEHWSQAEKHLAAAAAIETDGDQDSTSAWHQRQAHVHATLALAAATALPGQHPGDWEREIWSFSGELPPEAGPETAPSLPPLGPPIGASRHGPGCGCPYCPPADEVIR